MNVGPADCAPARPARRRLEAGLYRSKNNRASPLRTGACTYIQVPDRAAALSMSCQCTSAPSTPERQTHRNLRMKYRLTQKIGSGGMAEVFRATGEGPEGFERAFVVKRILPRLSEAPEPRNQWSRPGHRAWWPWVRSRRFRRPLDPPRLAAQSPKSMISPSSCCPLSFCTRTLPQLDVAVENTALIGALSLVNRRVTSSVSRSVSSRYCFTWSARVRPSKNSMAKYSLVLSASA